MYNLLYQQKTTSTTTMKSTLKDNHLRLMNGRAAESQHELQEHRMHYRCRRQPKYEEKHITNDDRSGDIPSTTLPQMMDDNRVSLSTNTLLPPCDDPHVQRQHSTSSYHSYYQRRPQQRLRIQAQDRLHV
eukprot:5903435-Amphidinium_carterae.1